MKKFLHSIKDTLITAVLLCAAFAISLLFQYIFQVQEHITTIFVFVVFLISLLTKGYVYGIVATLISAVAVNYAFTFPYFVIDFITPVNSISGVIMIVVSMMTSALTTKLKRHEAVKAESERERMRANLLRAVSHDLRTPLTTIYGSSTTLLEDSEALTQEQRRQIATGIKEDSQWLIRLVENLLSITRIDSGNVKIIKTPTVVEEVIDSVMLKFKKRYPEQKVELELPEDVVMVPMDAILIEQVLVNLLENAVQHAQGMTRLTLSVSPQGNSAVFEIRDDGCGIHPKRLESLFTGYFASREAQPDNRKNAGIGLSVCASIIKAHGGNITAQNSKTGGAVFRFHLDREEISDDTE